MPLTQNQSVAQFAFFGLFNGGSGVGRVLPHVHLCTFSQVQNFHTIYWATELPH